jgi:hypothetical protein
MLLLTPNSNLTGLYLKTFVPMDGKPRVSRTWCVSWLFSEPTHGPIDPETDEVRPRFRVRLVVSQGKNCRNRGFSGLLSPETEGGRLFCRARRRPWLSAGVLGGSWGFGGRTWGIPTHCRGVWLPRELCALRSPASWEGGHAYPRVLTLFLGWGRGYPGSQRGPVGLSGAQWMGMGAIKHVSGRPAPKGALRPQARPLPGRMHARHASVPSWGGGRTGGAERPGA